MDIPRLSARLPVLSSPYNKHSLSVRLAWLAGPLEPAIAARYLLRLGWRGDTPRRETDRPAARAHPV